MQSVRTSVRRGFITSALLTLALVACGDDGPEFVDAGRDASIDAPDAPAGMLPTSIPLAITDCGASSSQTFTVMNSGTADLTYTLALSDAAFSVTPASGTIVVGATTTFTVGVTVPQGATAGTALTATLTATTNLPGSPHTVPVTVTPRGAHIVLTPPSVGFGQVEAGTTSTASQVLVANTGNAPATVTIAAPGGEFNRLFGTSGTLNLAGGQSADATFTYAPTAVGADTGSAAITVTGVHCGAAPTSIALTGTGAVTGGVLVQGTPVDFGNRACGSASSTAQVTLVNSAEIAAQFTVTFPTDAEGDEARYSVDTTSGTIPANDQVVLTVTRSAIALPFQPRAVDAIMRVNVNIPSSTNTDVPLEQTLTGPFLTATPTTQDFGYASVGGSRSGPVAITNTGNATATLQTTVSAPFALALPAMVNGGTSGNGTMTYTPSALGTQTATATVTSAGLCSAPVTFTFTAGDGPLATFNPGGPVATCPVSGPLTNGQVNVGNGGNQSLDVTCIDLDSGTNGFATTFAPSPLSVGAGSAGIIATTVALPSPVRAGVTSTMLRCTTNEPLGNTYDLPFARSIAGTDIELAAADPLDFTCGVPARLPYTVTSAATSNLQGFVTGSALLVMPLANEVTEGTLTLGSAFTFNVSVHGGGSGSAASGLFGVPDPCAGSANPGDVVFTGQVSVGMGSGNAICSVTPGFLPVQLFQGTP